MSKATKENSHINLSTTSLQEKEADKCGNHQNALNNKVIINKKKTKILKPIHSNLRDLIKLLSL